MLDGEIVRLGQSYVVSAGWSPPWTAPSSPPSANRRERERAHRGDRRSLAGGTGEGRGIAAHHSRELRAGAGHDALPRRPPQIRRRLGARRRGGGRGPRPRPARGGRRPRHRVRHRLAEDRSTCWERRPQSGAESSRHLDRLRHRERLTEYEAAAHRGVLLHPRPAGPIPTARLPRTKR